MAGQIFKQMEMSRFAGRGWSPAPVCYSAVECTRRLGCSPVWGKSWLLVVGQRFHCSERIGTDCSRHLLVFNRDFQNHHVLFQSDNSTVAAALQQGMCQNPRVLQLLRMLHFVVAHYDFTFMSAHLPGWCNTLTDAIS